MPLSSWYGVLCLDPPLGNTELNYEFWIMRRKLITSYLIIIIFLFRIFRCWNQFRPMQFDLPWRISRTRTSGQSVRRCLEVLTTSIENLLDATFIQSVPPVSKFIHCSQTKRFHLICKFLLPLFLLLMCADFQHVCASYDCCCFIRCLVWFKRFNVFWECTVETHNITHRSMGDSNSKYLFKDSGPYKFRAYKRFVCKLPFVLDSYCYRRDVETTSKRRLRVNWESNFNLSIIFDDSRDHQPSYLRRQFVRRTTVFTEQGMLSNFKVSSYKFLIYPNECKLMWVEWSPLSQIGIDWIIGPSWLVIPYVNIIQYYCNTVILTVPYVLYWKVALGRPLHWDRTLFLYFGQYFPVQNVKTVSIVLLLFG